MWLCERGGGGPRPCTAALCHQRSYLCHRSSPSFASRAPPFSSPHKLSCLSSPPFLCLLSFQQEDPCVWEVVVFLPAAVAAGPPQPQAIVARPSFVCILRLLLKIKNSPFHPLYCFLVGCPCHSLGFYVLAGYLSSPHTTLAHPPSKGYLCCLPSPIFSLSLQRGINNFTETFIECLIAGISHRSAVVRKTRQRQTQVFGGVSKGLVTTRAL